MSMSLRPGEIPGRGIAVFPFLKTTDPIQLGSFKFRSTDDTVDLPEDDAVHVREIAGMLFLKDDLRIRSASYAMLPPLDLDAAESSVLVELARIQAIVAYCYSAPRHTFGDLFFHFEHASFAIFSPEPVPTFLVRPDHHVVPARDAPPLDADEWHRVPGYRGRYNFRHPFWAVKDSRLYPPLPDIVLNDGQNLVWDLGMAFAEAPQHHLLPTLLQEPLSEASKRALTAIDRYNRANSFSADDSEAILLVAVAFEALLGLPREGKTNHFSDAVSLLLGRVPRLTVWAEQFYNARSDVAHEGRTLRLRLMPTIQKKDSEGPLYQSLLAYGRQIFQLCVGSVLFGAQLAQRAGLQDKLVTNQERFVDICKTLDGEGLAPSDRLTAIDGVLATVEEFRYVQETGLLKESMLGALQAAAKNLLKCDTSLDPSVNQQLSDLASAKRSTDWYEVLAALHSWHDVMPTGCMEPRSPEGVVRRLTVVVWDYTFMHYFWMKKERERSKGSSPGADVSSVK